MEAIAYRGLLRRYALRHHHSLVHPGNEERGWYRIDQETAASALTILLNALRDLAPSATPPASSA